MAICFRCMDRHTDSMHAHTHTYTYPHITFHLNYINLIYLISSMYLTGVCNYLTKYFVYNNCNKILMGHIAHLRKICKYFQLFLLQDFPLEKELC